ncbi:hypothetical protein [Candidatus Mycoplasma haematohominis]|uniref:hypothetical protein n=1 Tax=Candidatus Mycoplasma haematohominis TaxID=1494318 RepID=UPI001C0A7429|nr:hypothetical protein [Candidatus Mycoplasma haemohominis]
MEFIKGKIKLVDTNYIIIETNNGIGIKLWTAKEDSFLTEKEYKIHTYEEQKLDNSNILIINRFGFLSSNTLNLFRFLVSIKGIGSKGAISIINSMGGTYSLIDALLDQNHEKIANISKKYLPLIIGSLSKPSNKELLKKLISPTEKRNIRSEVIWVLKEMELDEDKTEAALNEINFKLISEGKTRGIEGLKLEEAIKETLALLSLNK